MLDLGFAVYRNVFSDEECGSLVNELSANNAFDGAGKRHLMSVMHVADLASDSRLMKICLECSGKKLVPYKATLFNKTGKANWLVAWHQDTALPIECEAAADGWGPRSIKDGVTFSHAPSDVLSKILALRIHLDTSTMSNGPLRVIPNSHKMRISDDLEFRRIVESGPQVELTVGRGGVIAMSPLLIHASSKCMSEEPRRVLHIEYAEAFEIDTGVRLTLA